MIGKFSFKALVITLGFLALSTLKALEWKASCGSKYSNWFGTYTFHVKQGEVGGCSVIKKHNTGNFPNVVKLNQRTYSGRTI